MKGGEGDSRTPRRGQIGGAESSTSTRAAPLAKGRKKRGEDERWRRFRILVAKEEKGKGEITTHGPNYLVRLSGEAWKGRKKKAIGGKEGKEVSPILFYLAALGVLGGKGEEMKKRRIYLHRHLKEKRGIEKKTAVTPFKILFLALCEERKKRGGRKIGRGVRPGQSLQIHDTEEGKKIGERRHQGRGG